MRLQRLTEAEVHQLLVNIAGHSVRPIFAAEIFRQTEGNPFFIGEAIRTLILEGKIKKVGDRWQATVDISQLELPHSVRLLIERRLVHLSPECRTSMALAAVLGRQFSSALLCQARNLSEDAVAEHIDDAIRAQILSVFSAAWACMLLGQLEEGQRLAHEALVKAQQQGVVGAQGWANLMQAFLAIQAGQWEEAEKRGDSAYAIATMLHDADMQARILWSRSVCDGWRDDWQCAIANSS